MNLASSSSLLIVLGISLSPSDPPSPSHVKKESEKRTAMVFLREAQKAP